MENTAGYLSRAWDDLTSDENWWQVILVLGLVNCVPVVGQIFTMGYLFDWAKEGAWGMTRPLPREVGDFKRRARYGGIWLAVTLVWVVPVWAVSRVLGLIPGVGTLLRLLADLVMVAAFVVAQAATLRGVVYERVLPGLQVDRVLRMAGRDVPGLAQVFCIALLELIVVIVALVLVMIPAAPFIISIAGLAETGVLGVNLVPTLVLGIVTVVTSLFVWIVASVCATAVLALFVRGIGLWMRQFEPARWGSPHEPMPFEKEQAAPARPEGAEGQEAPVTSAEAEAEAEAAEATSSGEAMASSDQAVEAEGVEDADAEPDDAAPEPEDAPAEDAAEQPEPSAEGEPADAGAEDADA